MGLLNGLPIGKKMVGKMLQKNQLKIQNYGKNLIK
jgi:hypothetical protein